MRNYKTNQRRSGSATLEACFVFWWLIVITFGGAEFGYFFYIKHTLQGAAREGARAAVTPDATNTDVTSAIQTAMTAAGIASNKYTIKIRDGADSADVNVASETAGNAILVKVECTWGNVGISTLPMELISKTKVVRGQTTMRKEG